METRIGCCFRRGVATLILLLLILPSVSFAFLPHATTSRSTDAIVKLFAAKPDLGSIVSIECKLLPEGDFVPEPLIDGIVIHDDDPPVQLEFVLGEGNYLPGLHDLVANMEIGDTIQDVSLDAGWGSWNPNLQATMSLDALKGSGLDPSLIKVGVELLLQNGAKAIVKEVTDTEFVIDANPPMSGASYLASVKLLAIEAGPSSNLIYNPANKADEDMTYQVATFALGKFFA